MSVLKTDNLLWTSNNGFKQSELNTSNNKGLQQGGRGNLSKIRLSYENLVLNGINRLSLRTLSVKVKESFVNRVRFSQVFLNLSRLISVSPNCRHGSRCIAV